MDKIAKALERLTNKERQEMKLVLLQIKSGSFSDLDIKKLKGYDDIFRVRKGNMSIIFKKSDNSIEIIKLKRRGKDTYKLKM